MAKIEREKINANEEELINDIKTKHTKQGSMLDAARKIGELRDSGMTSADISRHIGKTAMFVSDCLKLIDNATPKIISHIESGQLSSTIALEMLKDIPASEVEEAVNSVLVKKAAKEEPSASGKRKKKVTPLKLSEIEEEYGGPMTAKSKKALQG